jgi:hypothetical protein
MMENLLSKTWTNLDSFELRLLLDARIGGPGQYDGDDDKLYLPLGGSLCRIALTFKDKKIEAIEPRPAFDAAEWGRIIEEIEKSILVGPSKVGRNYSFSRFRVEGSWRGARCGVQILPPRTQAPRAHPEMADHPFILEFSIRASDFWPVTNDRRLRQHRKLTLLLGCLLAGRISLQPRRSEHLWARVPQNGEAFGEIKWVEPFFQGELGDVVSDELSPPNDEQIEQLESEAYYARVGNDPGALRVPADLDHSICRYLELSPVNRAKFDRAAFWMDMAWRQWTISVSSSLASLVSAVESLTERGAKHKAKCIECNADCQHEVPGATESFRAFFEEYAPGESLRKRRTLMYSLRSGILHGRELMQLDQDLAFGSDPPWWKERELHFELWSLTRIALRNWLKRPPGGE